MDKEERRCDSKGEVGETEDVEVLLEDSCENTNKS